MCQQFSDASTKIILLVYRYKYISYNTSIKLIKGRGDEIDEMDSFLPNKIQT
jgi:hypothetical protein